jgi:hypothetical protein
VSKDQGLPIASAGSIALTMTMANVLGGYPVTAANQVISGAQILVAEGRTERVAQVVLTACEASDNYPPGRPKWAIQMVTRIPGGIFATMQLLRFRAASRAPAAGAG